MEYSRRIIHEARAPPPASRMRETIPSSEQPAAGDAGDRRGYPWLRLLRLHHWLKNVLLAVPFLTAQAWSHPGALAGLALGFIAFSLVASASYVLNDLADVAHDREHAAKRHRPLAAGDIGAGPALAVAAVIGLAGLAVARQVGAVFLTTLLVYAVLTTLYTRRLKRVALLDVLALAALWTLRLVAGAAAIHVELSVWLLSFGASIFLSLSLVKRCAELAEAAGEPARRLPGRGYERRDLGALQAFGIATGVVSVLVLAMFVDSTAAQLRYPHHERLWLACPAIWFWLGRIWLETARGGMHHDPIVFSLRDPASWAAFGAVAAVWAAALAPF